MHSLIRDMGREIIHGKSPNLPGKRSRLWFHEDALNVLREHTVRGICIYIYKEIYIHRHITYVLCRCVYIYIKKFTYTGT
jgi:hypothetical protein